MACQQLRSIRLGLVWRGRRIHCCDARPRQVHTSVQRGWFRRGAHQARGLARRRHCAAGGCRLGRYVRVLSLRRDGAGQVHLRQRRQARLCAGGRKPRLQVGRPRRYGDGPHLYRVRRDERQAAQDVLDGAALERSYDRPLREVREALRPQRADNGGAWREDKGHRRLFCGRVERRGQGRVPRPVGEHALRVRPRQRAVHPRLLRLGLVQHDEAHPGRRGRRARRDREEGFHWRGDHPARDGILHQGPLAVADNCDVDRDDPGGRVWPLLLPAQGPLFVQSEEQQHLPAARDRRRAVAHRRLLDGGGRLRRELAVRALPVRLHVEYERDARPRCRRLGEDPRRLHPVPQQVPDAERTRPRTAGQRVHRDGGSPHVPDAGRLLLPQARHDGQRVVPAHTHGRAYQHRLLHPRGRRMACGQRARPARRQRLWDRARLQSGD